MSSGLTYFNVRNSHTCLTIVGGLESLEELYSQILSASWALLGNFTLLAHVRPFLPDFLLLSCSHSRVCYFPCCFHAQKKNSIYIQHFNSYTICMHVYTRLLLASELYSSVYSNNKCCVYTGYMHVSSICIHVYVIYTCIQASMVQVGKCSAVTASLQL